MFFLQILGSTDRRLEAQRRSESSGNMLQCKFEFKKYFLSLCCVVFLYLSFPFSVSSSLLNTLSHIKESYIFIMLFPFIYLLFKFQLRELMYYLMKGKFLEAFYTRCSHSIEKPSMVDRGIQARNIRIN